jgi:hypothetical protein
MNRFVAFVLLGPLLGAVTMFGLLAPKLVGTWGQSHDHAPFFLLSIGLAYVFGIIPAGLAGWIDARFSGRPLVKIPVMAVVGYAGAMIAFISACALVNAMNVFWQIPMLAGLIGAIPAAVCSWLSSEKRA